MNYPANKQKHISRIKELVTSDYYDAVFVIGFNQVKAAQMNELRSACHYTQAKVAVAKNNLSRKAVTETWCHDIGSQLQQNVSIVFTKDPVGTSKAIQNLIKNKIPLKVVDALLRKENPVRGVKLFNYLQTIPNREELLLALSQACLKPMHCFNNLLQTPLTSLVRNLDSMQQTKS